jgi:hypothetical protein
LKGDLCITGLLVFPSTPQTQQGGEEAERHCVVGGLSPEVGGRERWDR